MSLRIPPPLRPATIREERALRICICATQVPFAHGGAEILVQSLRRELVARNFEVDVVTVPFSWVPLLQSIKSAFAWRLLELQTMGDEAIDLVIATRFPSYLIRHPNKVVWLIHQFRQVYDLLGTPYSDFTNSPEDRAIGEMIRKMDHRGLSECRRLFAIAGNTARRLQEFNGLEAEVLYPPPSLAGSASTRGFSDYVLGVGRLDRLKRFDLLVRSMRHTRDGVRAKIAGTGPEREGLARLIEESGLGDRVELLGWVEDSELAELYANSLAVFYAPYDEDYGFTTVEAFKHGKPVLSATDSGAVLEFVEEGRSGFLCPSDAPKKFGRRIDALFADRDLARRLGEDGRQRVSEVSWDRVITSLTGSGGGQ